MPQRYHSGTNNGTEINGTVCDQSSSYATANSIRELYDSDEDKARSCTKSYIISKQNEISSNLEQETNNGNSEGGGIKQDKTLRDNVPNRNKSNDLDEIYSAYFYAFRKEF